ncbi:hypothetical protein CW304_28585 [Bacillus sp. UFRGS-B20]|nr:hypothetical protein CW304_28585 [Bacillus sp. UFRGS-B20]
MMQKVVLITEIMKICERKKGICIQLVKYRKKNNFTQQKLTKCDKNLINESVFFCLIFQNNQR